MMVGSRITSALIIIIVAFMDKTTFVLYMGQNRCLSKHDMFFLLFSIIFSRASAVSRHSDEADIYFKFTV